jgi:hypothetical protein
MKKTILTLLIALVVFPLMLNAQNSSIDNLYNKYAGKDGYTSVNISKEMFKLLASFQEYADDKEAKIIMKAIDNLDGLKIITQEGKQDAKTSGFHDDIKKLLKKGKFVDLMTVKEKGSDATFLLRKKGKDIIELLMIATEGSQKTIISFFGLIDLETIALLSKNVKMKGMPSMDQLEKHIKGH